MLMTETTHIEKLIRKVHANYGARIARRLQADINSLQNELFDPVHELRKVLTKTNPEISEEDELNLTKFKM